eukprot:TRINITY_DN15384_c0_g1_i1.p1 TRINITY_DN15384_c0_g1~~TRINITY_DN15384_c0_g1_i1.p1  ORF type:complete len:1287 (+),score=690.06 TRINITY_DN15384_c0_g1_i1:71-3931(+)
MASSTSSGLQSHIEALELTDFKSYAGTHYVGPFRDFTCIIGPNGSGKSNLMDAISFVLGIKTASLRAATLKELVHKDAGSAATQATVKLHFVDKKNKKVVFQRTVSTAGTTQYRVNGKAMAWGAYENELRSHNILASTRNCLIFQGEVEQMAHKNPKDITAMIELVSGSGELKAEYEARKKEHDDAVEKVRSAGRLKRGAGEERGIMEDHKKEAEKYHALMNDISQLKVTQALLQFYHIETALVKIKNFQRVAQTDVNLKEGALAKAEKQFGAAKSTTNKLYEEVHKATRAERAGQHDANKLREAAQEVDVRRGTLQAEVARLDHQLGKAKGEQKKSNQRVETLRKDMGDQQLILKHFEATWEEEDKETGLSDTDYKEFLQLREKAQAQTVGTTQSLKQQQREVDNLQHRLSSLMEVKKDETTRLEATETRLAHLMERAEEGQRLGNEGTDQGKEWADELANTERHLHNVRRELGVKEERLRELGEAIATMRTNREERKTQQRMDAALSDMKEMYQGVHGRLHQLIKIPNSLHASAVVVALGKHMDAVVTDTDRTAHDCVQYLKDQRVGTMNFIPLSSVRGKDVTDSHRVLGGTAVPVLDRITYPPWLAPALKYAIGQTIMCDDVEEGQRVAWEMATRFKVVTLDGTVMQKNGVMTGGAASVAERAKKFAQAELAADLEVKKQERDKLAQDVRTQHTDLLRAQQKEAELRQQVESDNRRKEVAQKQAQLWEEKRVSTQKELDELRSRGGGVVARIESVQRELKASEKQKDLLRAKLREEESKVFGDFGARVNIKDIHDYDSRILTKERDRAEKRSKVNSIIVQLQAQIDYEEKSDKALSPEQLAKSLATSKGNLAAAQKEAADKTKAVEQKDKAVKDLKHDLDEKTKLLRKADEEIGKLKRDLNSALAKAEEVRKKPQALLTVRDRLRAQRAALYTRCVADDIRLPTVAAGTGKKRKRASTGDKSSKGGPGDHVEAESDGEAPADTSVDDKGFITVSEPFASSTDGGGAKAGKRTTSDVGKQSAQQLLGIDFSSLPKKLREAVRDNKDNKAQKYREELALLDHQIEKKSDVVAKLAPNLKAEEKFRGMSSKVKQTAEDFASAQQLKKERGLAFLKVKEKRSMLFEKAFNIISKEVSVIYRLLTQGTRGEASAGYAMLHCQDLDERYLGATKFSACPPQKGHREMDQLSGGEKTIAALALLFAIHKVCPSPFFVLDEVDAALDAPNVARVIRYVQASRTHCQFLVISLKSFFYETASSLVGVRKIREENTSGVLTLDLTQYDTTEEA